MGPDKRAVFTDSQVLSRWTTTVQTHCLTSVLQLGCARWFMLRKRCVYIIFGSDPCDLDSWLQARLSDAMVSQGEERVNKAKTRRVDLVSFFAQEAT